MPVPLPSSAVPQRASAWRLAAAYPVHRPHRRDRASRELETASTGGNPARIPARHLDILARPAGRPTGLTARRARVASDAPHLTSTVAPFSSSTFLILSASSLLTPSLTTFGAPSTRSLASFRPRPVMVRISLMTLIFLSPAAFEDDGEFRLLLGRGGGGAAASRRRRRRDRRRGGNAPLLFQHLGELGGFQDGQAGELVNELCEIGHVRVSSDLMAWLECLQHPSRRQSRPAASRSSPGLRPRRVRRSGGFRLVSSFLA